MTRYEYLTYLLTTNVIHSSFLDSFENLRDSRTNDKLRSIEECLDIAVVDLEYLLCRTYVDREQKRGSELGKGAISELGT
jgi:hypothetical protein